MKFDPEKSLFELPVVKHIVSVTVFFAVIAGVVISFKSKLLLRLDYEGFNTLIEIFKVPLGILAVGLTLIGICGANHRSEQTRRQIERTAKQIDLTTTQIEINRGQNYFSNYYKHIEEFEKYVKHVDGPYRVQAIRRLYGKIFPNARAGIYGVSSEFIEGLDEFILRFFSFASELDTMDHADYQSALYGILKLRKDYMSMTEVADENLSGTILRKDNDQVIVPDGTPRGTFESFVSFCAYVDKLLQFDEKYSSTKRIQAVKSIRLDEIHSWKVGDKFASIRIEELVDKPLS